MVSVAMKLRQINSIPVSPTTAQPGKLTFAKSGISESPTLTTPGILESPTLTTPGILESPTIVVSEKLIKSCLHGLTKRYGGNRSSADDGSELLSFVALEASVDDIFDLKNTSAGLFVLFFICVCKINSFPNLKCVFVLFFRKSNLILYNDYGLF